MNISSILGVGVGVTAVVIAVGILIWSTPDGSFVESPTGLPNNSPDNKMQMTESIQTMIISEEGLPQKEVAMTEPPQESRTVSVNLNDGAGAGDR